MASPTSGHLWLLYIETTAATALAVGMSWQVIGGQQGLNRDRSLDTADVTDKDSNNESEFIALNKSSTLSMDGLVEVSDVGQGYLETMHESRQVRAIRIVDAAGNSFKAMAICTSLSHDAPEDDAVKLSAEFQITGGWQTGS